MLDAELKRYVDQKIKHGFSENQITEALLGAGYKKEEITAAIYQAKKPNEPTDKIKKQKISKWWFVLLFLLVFLGLVAILYLRVWDPVWNPFNEYNFSSFQSVL
ncbi:MAG: hypothetical protein R3346_01960 [Candidatus Spechtbacterales bacterium]|nr:hypothetical protein [Candidatus Spechtbacterales bacterium]